MQWRTIIELRWPCTQQHAIVFINTVSSRVTGSHLGEDTGWELCKLIQELPAVCRNSSPLSGSLKPTTLFGDKICPICIVSAYPICTVGSSKQTNYGQGHIRYLFPDVNDSLTRKSLPARKIILILKQCVRNVLLNRVIGLNL